MNKYSGVSDNTALFDMYAHEIVDEMLLYNSITMPYKSLYLNGVKKEIFKYEGLYNQGHQIDFNLSYSLYSENICSIFLFFSSILAATDFGNSILKISTTV
jgi:hypothetical protein